MLLKTCICAIIIKRDCNRYAMKRKVAGGMSGNFRGVCPINGRQRILNRSAWMRFRGVPSSRCVSVTAKRQNLFLPRYSGVLGIILKTSVAEPSVFPTERPCNMCRRSFADFWRKNGMLPEFPSV